MCNSITFRNNPKTIQHGPSSIEVSCKRYDLNDANSSGTYTIFNVEFELCGEAVPMLNSDQTIAIDVNAFVTTDHVVLNTYEERYMLTVKAGATESREKFTFAIPAQDFENVVLRLKAISM